MKSSTTWMMVLVVALAAIGCGVGSEDTAASLTSAIKTVGDTAETNATDGGRPRRKPPEAAYTACESKATGDACTITHDDHTITGTCVAPPAEAEDTRIHCRPDRMPEGGPPGGGGRNGGGGGDCPEKGEPGDAEESPTAS